MGMGRPRAEFIGGRWVHPSEAETAFSWFNVTTWADHDWKKALNAYWTMRHECRYDTHRLDEANRFIKNAREDYRARVLSWHFRLNVPMQLGECVPSTVAELIAEAWDLGEWRWWRHG